MELFSDADLKVEPAVPSKEPVSQQAPLPKQLLEIGGSTTNTNSMYLTHYWMFKSYMDYLIVTRILALRDLVHVNVMLESVNSNSKPKRIKEKIGTISLSFIKQTYLFVFSESGQLI